MKKDLTLIFMIIIAIVFVFIISSAQLKNAPCDRFVDFSINSIPARCASYFGLPVGVTK